MNELKENDLIAYHLLDLSPTQARQVRRALKINPELAAQSEAILATLRLFDKTEETPMTDVAVLNRNWNNLQASLHVIQPQTRWQPWRKMLLLGGTLVLLIVAAIYIARPHRTDAPGTIALKGDSQSAVIKDPTAGFYISNPLSTSKAGSLQHRPSPALTAPSSLSSLQTKLGATDEFLLAAQTPQLAQVSIPQSIGTSTPVLTPGNVPKAPNANPVPIPADKRKQHETDLSIGIFGDFTITGSTGSATGSGTTANTVARSQSAVPAAGALVTFHQQFQPLLGYRVSTGYTHTTFNYTYGASNANSSFFYGGGIGTHVLELTAAYVVQGPNTKRLSSFADVGGGMLTFIPTTSTDNTSYVFRPAAVAGAGVDFKLTPRLALRSEFRAISFRGPDFRYHNGSIPVTTRYTFSSEPTIGLTYQFGKPSK